ncbi:beta-galactosidase 13 [Rosa sericea]
MVVPSQRVLLISFLLLLVSTTLVHAKGNKPKPEGGGAAAGDGGDGDEGEAAGDTTEDGAVQGGKKQLAHGPVTYDARSVIINGKHELLFSGSIHYPRSSVEMWPDILKKAKQGGLNVIQTYVFWNIHEPVQGKWEFEGNYDLVKFIRLIQENGMYATLRVGPFIQAEWNHGGLPYWLREVPQITFRSDNEPYKKHMEQYVTKIMKMMKDEKLFAPQGGPIILAQIENEYNQIQLAYRELGDTYVQWAANLAVGQNIGVPWIMCKQKDAPDPVINTCNGRHCGDTFSGPNKPNKPALWTENWTAQYRVFGDPPSQRAAEDIAFSVARFFSKGGALTNYYMYHGGTNFGRTSAVFTTTRYYDEAPLDEYALQRDPKWSHLKDLHKAINLCKKTLLTGTPGDQRLGEETEVRFYEKPGTECAAFIANNHSTMEATVNWRGQKYLLPPASISILPDCKTVVFNTQQIVSQHNSRNYVTASKKMNWEMSPEPIATVAQIPSSSREMQELYGLLKDTTDYAWYTTSIDLSPYDLPMKETIRPVVRIPSLGHAMVVFVNDEYIGSQHGSHAEKGFVFEAPAKMKLGANHISLLCMTVGLPDSGAYMEHRYAGPRSVTILGLNTGTIDLSANGWGHRAGLNGEKLEVYTEKGAQKVKWTKATGKGRALTWYKTSFDAPSGRDPCAIRMTGMGKGMVWVNGISIGRHWMSFLSPLGQPTQTEYHIPRAFIKPKNFLVVLEEEPADPKDIEIVTVNRDTICSLIKQDYPGHVKYWDRKGGKLATAPGKSLQPSALLNCPNYKKISAIEFAGYGNPDGFCGTFKLGQCNAPEAKKVVEDHCLGKISCTVPNDPSLFFKSGDPCPGIKKTLAIQAACSF